MAIPDAIAAAIAEGEKLVAAQDAATHSAAERARRDARAYHERRLHDARLWFDKALPAIITRMTAKRQRRLVIDLYQANVCRDRGMKVVLSSVTTYRDKLPIPGPVVYHLVW